MPAYNAGEYLPRAIDSIIDQSYPYWDLIIINDASTDNTEDIIKCYAKSESRIKYLNLTFNQGNAYNVRKIGIEHALHEFVSPLDADDWIEPTYLEKLIKRLIQTKADIVYPTMINPTTKERIVPLESFDINNVDIGKNFVIDTLVEWKIGANGGIIKKYLYLNLFQKIFNTNYIFSDEYLTRRLLYDANIVAFSDAKYFYFQNDSSVTHKPTSRIFDKFICDKNLSEFIIPSFGRESDEYRKLQIQRFFNIVAAIRYLNKNNKTLSKFAKNKGRLLINRAYGSIDWNTVHDNIGWKYYYMMKTGLLCSSRFLKIYDRFFTK